MLLNRFFRLEMVKGDPNHHPRTLNAPFRAARHPGVQTNKTGSIHLCIDLYRSHGKEPSSRIEPELTSSRKSRAGAFLVCQFSAAARHQQW